MAFDDRYLPPAKEVWGKGNIFTSVQRPPGHRPPWTETPTRQRLPRDPSAHRPPARQTSPSYGKEWVVRILWNALLLNFPFTNILWLKSCLTRRHFSRMPEHCFPARRRDVWRREGRSRVCGVSPSKQV